VSATMKVTAEEFPSNMEVWSGDMTQRLIICFLILSGIPVSSFSIAQPILNGAGATFPAPLYRKWIEEYRRVSDTRIVYRETGSGVGVQLFLDRQVDFGATDVYLSDAELEKCPWEIIHVPTCLSAVSIIFNLQHIMDIRLTPNMLAQIFMGQITRWSDDRLVRINPELSGVELDITVIHRSDSSGTTFIFSDYLSKSDHAWSLEMGRGNVLQWPVGMGLEGNPGLTEYVKKIPGSIGYVSLNHAIENRLRAAHVQNRAGNFIQPSLPSVSLAGDVAIPKDLRVLITDTTSTGGYPISAFTYLVVYKEQGYLGRSRETAESLAGFLRWVTTKGQAFAESMNYAHFPPSAASIVKKAIHSMMYQGDTIWNSVNQ
ncbi:MAG: phosphate ABC transporter substrate-binding protein PstS, partial [Desulfatirhabdiaceae bacterium]